MDVRHAAQPLRLASTQSKHLRGVVNAIDVETKGEKIEQQPSRPAADVEDGLAAFADELEVEGAILPAGRIAAEGVPGVCHDADVLDVGFHGVRLLSPLAGRRDPPDDHHPVVSEGRSVGPPVRRA
jgi:hypothetical protein